MHVSELTMRTYIANLRARDSVSILSGVRAIPRFRVEGWTTQAAMRKAECDATSVSRVLPAPRIVPSFSVFAFRIRLHNTSPPTPPNACREVLKRHARGRAVVGFSTTPGRADSGPT